MEDKMFFLLPVLAYTKIKGERLLVLGWFHKSIIIKIVT